MPKYLSFDFCPHCGKTLFNPSGEKTCYKCGRPFQEYYHEELTGNEWIAIRKEATKEDMLYWFYGIRINPSLAESMQMANHIEENGINWIVGIASNVIQLRCK